MEWKIRLEARTGWGEATTYEVGVLRRDLGDLTSNSVGLGLAEAKALRVVPAIPFATHRHRDASRLELASIVLRSVLRPTVRVMHQARIGIAPPQCNVQRAQRQLLRHRLAHCPAYELARVQVQHQRQVQPAFLGRSEERRAGE